ncbi:MAG: hypothetical protein J7K22_00120 [Nanoarchaeota archaeon]|nr:hypothetical protein [Nanoarchaeota archaeon]
MSEIVIFQPCRTGAAFQGTPKKNLKLNMNKVKEVLSKKGFKIKLALKDVVIAEKKYVFNIFKDGRIMIKEIKNEEEAKKQIKNLFKLIKETKD